MEKFYNNPIDLIESAARVAEIKKDDNVKLEKVNGAVSPINGYSIYKKKKESIIIV